MNRTRTIDNRQGGFTIMQMVVTIAIIAVLSTLGFLGITNARAHFRLQNSARLFATYLEKARADAIRRHAAAGNESSVETFGAGTSAYTVSMDFGDGAVTSRTFQLDPGVTFSTAAKKLTFDWRGRIVEKVVWQLFTSGLQALPVDVSGSGDITVGEQHFPDNLIPAVEIAAITGDTIPDPTPDPLDTPPGEVNPDPTPSPTATPTPTPDNSGNGGGYGSGGSGGGGPHSSPTPTPEPTPSQYPTPTPTPTPEMPPPCATYLSPSYLSLSQSDTGNLSGKATLVLTNATGVRTLSASQTGGGNSLNISLSLVRLEGNGYSVVTISTKNGAGNRGVFTVDIAASPSCGSTQQLTVSVSN
ncbi:MAG TPA: hypothetical protein VGQ39_01045 [Pyrinomonadaceae bacterium]|jgi:Tfp pilus assembly protein FimT|nr:hypothetical protein [Pyrinomonadaceae bacterium]